MPDLQLEDLMDERGIIVASIQSLYSMGRSKPQELEALGNHISCIVVDEAHHSVAPSYAYVLRKMGFNWDNRKKEISEKGIILLGLTATPFRGAGDEETRRLLRWYNGVYFPTIPDVESQTRPHALADCPSTAYVGDTVRMLGEKSYVLDGYIKSYSWSIRGDTLQQEYNQKNAAHIFREAGTYAIELTVTDNDDNTDVSSITLAVHPTTHSATKNSQMQKQLYGKLIDRRILCDVFHRVIVSKKAIDLTMKDASEIESYGEFQAKTLRQVGDLLERNSLLLTEIDRMRSLGRRKILFFGCSVEHSRKIAIALRAVYGINARYVDSAMDMDSRIAVIQEFDNGDVEVLCNFGVLTTGFDAPSIDCVFIGRPVRSALLYTQMIGRGMRGVKNSGTEDMVIVDVDDNFQINNLRYAPLSDNLGWKIYREYWKVWGSPAPEHDEYNADDDDPDVSHTCTVCGTEAVGSSKIKSVFGFECPTEMLIEMYNAGGLPPSCQKCRTQ